ncbi:MAG: L,D-transpeptidase family protein [Candidatus Omnitrophica bacterium]|nr:L,D-transpeptidase family protein [Candidatus Omnitrophota bacterium]
MTIIRIIPLLIFVFSMSSCAIFSQRDWRVPPDLLGSAVSQAVVVRPLGAGFRAGLTLWSKDRVSGEWRRTLGPWPVTVGRNGFASVDEKHEGDGRTPSGIFPLGPAFGREASIATGLGYRQAGLEDRWVDDPSSAQYNQWVKGEVAANSFENMLRADGLYDAGIVVQYNTRPVIPGRGSAIFVHIWRAKGQSPTAGCVALEKQRLLELLKSLDEAQSPVIIMGK